MIRNVSVPRRVTGMVRNWCRPADSVFQANFTPSSTPNGPTSSRRRLPRRTGCRRRASLRDLADASGDEGMAAEAPARRAIGDDHAGAVVQRVRVDQLVARERRRPSNSIWIRGRGSIAAAQHQRRPAAHAERITALTPTAALPAAELDDVDQRRLVAGAVFVAPAAGCWPLRWPSRSDSGCSAKCSGSV